MTKTVTKYDEPLMKRIKDNVYNLNAFLYSTFCGRFLWV